MVRIDSPHRGASFSCRTHASTIHDCGTMKGLWGSCLEEGENIKRGWGKASLWVYIQALIVFGSLEPETSLARGNARFGGIPRAWTEGALCIAPATFWTQPRNPINRLLAPEPRAWFNFLQATKRAPSDTMSTMIPHLKIQILSVKKIQNNLYHKMCIYILLDFQNQIQNTHGETKMKNWCVHSVGLCLCLFVTLFILDFSFFFLLALYSGFGSENSGMVNTSCEHPPI
jgi:hypothetical protein